MALQPRIIACGNSVAAFAMAVRFLTGPAVMAAASIVVGLRGVLLHVAIVQVSLSLWISLSTSIRIIIFFSCLLLTHNLSKAEWQSCSHFFIFKRLVFQLAVNEDLGLNYATPLNHLLLRYIPSLSLSYMVLMGGVEVHQWQWELNPKIRSLSSYYVSLFLLLFYVPKHKY